MRRRIMSGRRVYVRRSGPQPAVWITLMLMVALIAFVFFAKPTIGRLAIAVDEPTVNQAAVSGERVTRDISFEGLSLYVVELARLSDAAAARVEAARYVSRGAAGYVLPLEGAYAVVGAGYKTRAEADTVSVRLRESEAIAATVQGYTGEAVLLRVTATETQLGALTEAESALRQLTDALQAHALSLDRAEAQPVTVRAQLSVASASALTVRDRLTRAAGSHPNEVAQQLIARLSALADACARLSTEAQDTALTFSSKLKYAFIEQRLSEIEFLRGLAI